MSKFNAARKVPNSRKYSRKHLRLKKLKSPTGQDVGIQFETLVHGREKDRGVLRKSKYHKKLQSNMSRTMSKEIKGNDLVG